MGRLGRSRYLCCFYCGKRSSLKYDGKTTNFLCLSCDATNYLDETGEITDPPVATDREAAPSLYARPQPAVAEMDGVFCGKCLKNQRLFTASLAQYLPDDPSHPDYAELDRNYYRYRRNLEKRYPQVCDECADKVQDRIRQAGYTAKTDHLRRMMDKSRGRKPTQRSGPLDVASFIGGWLWRGGFVAQILWHLVCVVQALEESGGGMRDPDDTSLATKVLETTKAALTWLPNGDALIQASITAAILSSWWNPHFAKFARGFTRHLLGFTRWYSFQCLIVFFRILFRSALTLEGGASQSQSAQLSAHMATAGVMCLIYTLAGKSIKVDTTPLFRTEDKSESLRRATIPAKRKEEDSKTLSELFSEALDSTPQNSGISSLAAAPGTPRYGSENAFVPQSQSRFMQEERCLDMSPLANMSMFQQQQQQQQTQVDYVDDEMDWSPSQPQHRAFRNSPQQKETQKPFGQSPTQESDKRPFWFKVPAAPSNPARLLRNPPNMPVLRKKPVGKDEVFFASRGDDAAAFGGRRGEREASGSGFSGASTSFKNPSFFAPDKESDEANSLADLLGQSFSLSREQQQHEGSAGAAAGQGLSSLLSPASLGRARGWTWHGAGLLGLLVLAPLWLVTMALPWLPHQRELRGVILVAAGVIALGGTGDASDQTTSQQQPKVVDAVLSCLGMVELAGVCWVGWETWTAGMEVGLYGAAVLSLMLGHYTLEKARRE